MDDFIGYLTVWVGISRIADRNYDRLGMGSRSCSSTKRGPLRPVVRNNQLPPILTKTSQSTAPVPSLSYSLDVTKDYLYSIKFTKCKLQYKICHIWEKYKKVDTTITSMS